MMAMAGHMMFIAAKAVLPAKLDMNQPSTMLYTDVTISMSTIGHISFRMRLYP